MYIVSVNIVLPGWHKKWWYQSTMWYCEDFVMRNTPLSIMKYFLYLYFYHHLTLVYLVIALDLFSWILQEKYFVSNYFAWLVPNKSSKISGLFLTESWTGLSILVYNCQRVSAKILLLTFIDVISGSNSLIKALICLDYRNKADMC